MKNRTNGLILAATVACAALAAGCRTAGPWERHFRPTAAAPAPVPEAATIPPESVRTATFDPVEGAAAALARLAAAPLDTEGAETAGETRAVTNTAAVVELGRSAFVASRASRESAVAFAARLGRRCDETSFARIRVRWEHTWADPDPFWPPPPPPPRYRRGGPPPRWHHRPPPDPFWMDREEWRPVHLFRFFALFLRTAP